MQLQHIDLDNLKLSPLNVRKSGTKSGEDLIPSIQAMGIIQPLLVRPTRGEERGCATGKQISEGEERGCATGKQISEGYEVVAGQRRLSALQSIADEGTVEPVPCLIMDEGDDAVAIEASLAENIARLPMDVIDQFEAFQLLIKQGRSVADIAVHFGVPERLVTQRLAIAGLYQPIRNAYRRDEIDDTSLQILTMATTRQQREWYKLHKSDDEYAPTGYQLKSWLFGGEQIPVTSALFEIEDYPGVTISDLFGDEAYFADPELFWEHQSQAVARMVDEYNNDGWSEVILLDVGERFQSWEHVDTAKEDGGKVFIQISRNGEVSAFEGQLSRKEIKKREKAKATGKANGKEDAKPERPELTKAMQNYLDLHRHSAVRTELLTHPGLVLRLCVAQIIAGSGLWDVHADQQKADKQAITDSLQMNGAGEIFANERQAIRDLFQSGIHKGDTIVPAKDDWDINRNLHAILGKLIKMDDNTVNRIFAFVVAETLECGSATVEILGTMLNVDMSSHWQPDETFLDLLKDKEAINAILREVGGKTVADGNITATTKVQKSILQDFLNGNNGREQVQDWQPRYMAFPMKSYTKRSGITAINAYKAAKKHYAA